MDFIVAVFCVKNVHVTAMWIILVSTETFANLFVIAKKKKKNSKKIFVALGVNLAQMVSH